MCSYCNGEFALIESIHGEESHRVWVDAGEKLLHSMTVYEDGMCGDDWAVDIDHCPVCGRKL